MTEIHYVNRVDQSPFQKLEGEKLTKSRALEQLEKAAPLVSQVAENPAVQEGLAEQGVQVDGESLKQLVEEDPFDNIGNVDIASTSTPDPSTILLASLLKDSLAEIEFRRQVIAAFRHLGLDTRKHFGV